MDDSDWSDEQAYGARLCALPALALVVALLPIGIVAAGVLRCCRAWRGRT